MPTASRERRTRDAEHSLFEKELDSCIDAFAKFNISKRAVVVESSPQPTPCLLFLAPAARATSPPVNNTYNSINNTTISPIFTADATPSRASNQAERQNSPSPRPTATADMAPAPHLHSWSSQDARGGGNFAIQPTAAPARINLKQAAVKVVRPAEAAKTASTPAKPATPVASPPAATATSVFTPPAASSTPRLGALAPVTPSDAKDAVDMLKARALSQSPRPQPKLEEDDLDAIYARLMSPEPVAVSYPTPTSAVGKENEKNPRKSSFSFETPVKSAKKGENAGGGVPFGQSIEPTAAPLNKSTITEDQVQEKSVTPSVEQPVAVKKEPQQESIAEPELVIAHLTKEQLEELYLKKAFGYLHSLSEVDDGDARLVWVVATKMHRVINSDPSGTLDSSELATLKSKLVDNIAKYLDELAKSKNIEQPSVRVEWIKTLLTAVDGNFLGLTAKLVERQFIALDELKEVVGLCEAVNEALTTKNEGRDQAKKVSASGKKLIPVVWNDPMGSMKMWPTQPKRDNIPGCRQVMLKGVDPSTPIHDIQALVWGGRVESIHRPDAGKPYALVKFQTPEGCQNYFDATENGIQKPGCTKDFIFVERQGGPNSVNDVLQNCIDNDVTRCVRALNADDDWKMTTLQKLARGNTKPLRELDIITQGRTVNGRHYIEFRFSSVYHAMNFMRELRADEEDWEHCTISYALDPCEIARGVHFKDDA